MEVLLVLSEQVLGVLLAPDPMEVFPVQVLGVALMLVLALIIAQGVLPLVVVLLAPVVVMMMDMGLALKLVPMVVLATVYAPALSVSRSSHRFCCLEQQEVRRCLHSSFQHHLKAQQLDS